MTDTTLSLYADVQELDEIVMRLYGDSEAYKDGFSSGPNSLDSDLIALEAIQRVIGELRNIERDLSTVLGNKMGQRYHSVEETGTYERRARTEATKCTDEAGLFRYVSDTRIVDPDTGEIIPPAEVIRRAYGVKSKETGDVRLTGATPSKVEALGIDPDDFFEKGDFLGWTIHRK